MTTDSTMPSESSVGRISAIVTLACAAQFMVVLDISVVNVALPSMRYTLGFEPTALQWVVNGYALTFAGFLLLGGRLADVYGRKRIFLLGLALFSAPSLVGGSAGTPEVLVAARAVQGLGASVLAPATLTLITTELPHGRRRTRALAIWTAVGIAGGSAGNLVGGVLTQYLSWRWVLLINVPIGCVALIVAGRVLAGGTAASRSRGLDAPGAVLATIGLASFTYAVTTAESDGWGTLTTLAPLGIAAASLAAFIHVERCGGARALIPVHLFRVRAISAGNVVMLLAGASLMPMWYFLSLYMQEVLGYTAMQTGLGFLPHTLGTVVVATRVTPWLMDRVRARSLVVIGALVAAVGFGWQSLIKPDSGYVSGLLGPAIVIAVGGGVLNTPITTTVLSVVTEADAGAVAGLMNAAKQVGGAVGLASLVGMTAGSETLAASYTLGFALIAVILGAVAAAALTLPAGSSPVLEGSGGSAHQ